MTYWQQSGSNDLGFLAGVSKARPLSRGVGLAVGALASLGLWAALVWAALRLIG